MRQVSEKYNPFPRVREVDCRISFGVIARKAADAAISASETAFFGDLAQTADEIDAVSAKWASLEPDFWRLDGTYDIMPDDASGLQTGWWSSVLSGADGIFETPPFVEYMFDEELASIGWTLYFDAKTGQYPTQTRVELLSADGSSTETLVYAGESPVQAFSYPGGTAYTGVRFTFLSTSEPYRRVRLTEVIMGLIKRYDRDTLGNVSLIYGAALDASALPARELVFTFDNADGSFNLLDPDEIYRHLREGHTLDAELIVGGEAVYMGEYFFDHADTSQSVIVPQITAYDRAVKLDAYTFDSGRDEAVTLEAAIAEVLAVTGLDISAAFGGDTASRTVHMSVPVGTTVREAVRMLAQAARCTPYFDRESVLRFEDFSVKAVPDGEITADELYDYSGVSVSERVYGVRLWVQDEFRIGTDGTAGRQTAFYAGDEARPVGYFNPCIADSEGQAVADWLLVTANMMKRYRVRNRCDPAVEIGDTLRIADAYGNNGNAVVTGLDIRFGQSLSATTEAIGE